MIALFGTNNKLLVFSVSVKISGQIKGIGPFSRIL